jgi:hypothetical protein
VYVLPEPFSPVLVGTRWDASDRSERAAAVDYVVLDSRVAADSQWGRDNATLAALVRSNGFQPVLSRGTVTLFSRR